MDKDEGRPLAGDILNCAEDVILKKIKMFQESPEYMSDKDCYALQMLVMAEGRILSMRDAAERELTMYPGLTVTMGGK